MSSISNSDEWQTVGRSSGGRRWEPSAPAASRPMFGRRREEGQAAPAAFGGGNSERAEQARQAAEARRQFKEAESRTQRKAEETAAAKEAEATNFTSEVSYPSLGSTAAATGPKPVLNFKQAVKDMIAREAEAEVAAAAAAEAATYAELTSVSQPRKAQTLSRQRILDELEDDYDGPEEDESDGEVNADIGSGRRRGDKGIW
jgi:hypothetical protein